MEYIDIRIQFDEADTDADGYIHFGRPTSVTLVETNINLDVRKSIVETLVQSDWGNIEFPNMILDAIEES